MRNLSNQAAAFWAIVGIVLLGPLIIGVWLHTIGFMGAAWQAMVAAWR